MNNIKANKFLKVSRTAEIVAISLILALGGAFSSFVPSSYASNANTPQPNDKACRLATESRICIIHKSDPSLGLGYEVTLEKFSGASHNVQFAMQVQNGTKFGGKFVEVVAEHVYTDVFWTGWYPNPGKVMGMVDNPSTGKPYISTPWLNGWPT